MSDVLPNGRMPHLVTGGVLHVALLHTGADHAGEQPRLPDAVVIIKHGAPVAA